MRTPFSAHQKLLEQNTAAWQNKEQHAAQSLDRIAKRFEETANQWAARPQSACGELQTATKEHQAAATKAQHWVARVSLETRTWPHFGCTAGGALLALAVPHFLKP